MRFRFQKWVMFILWSFFLVQSCSKKFVKEYNLAVDFYENQNYENALTHFQTAINQKPGWTESHYGLGMTYYKMGNYEAAINHFLEALEISPHAANCLWGLGLAYSRTGNDELAVVSLKRSFELEPNADCAFNLGVILRELGRHSEARPHFLFLREKLPRSVEVLENLALCYEAEADWESAKATWQAALALESMPQRRQEIQNYLTAVQAQIDKLKPAPTDFAPSIIVYSPANEAQVFDESVKLTVKAFDDYGLAELSVYINGQKFQTERGIAIVDESEEKLSYLLETFIPLLPGLNEIRLEAKDTAGNIERHTVRVTRVRPRLFGLFVGISNYDDDSIPGLNYADRDATALYQLFKNTSAFDTSNLRLVKNEEATRARITESLAYFLSQSSPHDLVIIFLAGHGMLEAGEYFFIPHDGRRENLFGTAIKDVEFSSSLKRIGARRVLLLTDTCHSGVILPTERGANDSVRRFFDTLSKAEGRITITASQFNEVSLEDPRLQHGVFSYYLLEGLRGKADTNRDSVVGVMELYQFLAEKVPQVTRGGQHPVLLIPEGKVAGDVPLMILEERGKE